LKEGVGVAVVVAIFSAMENILMEPLPYPDAGRYMLVQIHDGAKDA
jgi:hypothetical protein